MTCPNSTESGCRCGEHHPGLLEYASDPEGLSAALKQLAEPPVLLRVLTTEQNLPNLVAVDKIVSCDGTMTCLCVDCVAERSARVRRGGRNDNFGGMPIKVRRAA